MCQQCNILYFKTSQQAYEVEYYHIFTDEANQIQWNKIICSKTQNWSLMEPGFKPNCLLFF